MAFFEYFAAGSSYQTRRIQFGHSRRPWLGSFSLAPRVDFSWWLHWNVRTHFEANKCFLKQSESWKKTNLELDFLQILGNCIVQFYIKGILYKVGWGTSLNEGFSENISWGMKIKANLPKVANIVIWYIGKVFVPLFSPLRRRDHIGPK